MKWTLDPSHSSIEFTVKHMALTSVRGRFTKFSGEGRTNASGATEWVKVVIDADSLTTAEDQRDAHLRSADFFDVAHHPELVFESTQVRTTAPDRYEVQGNLTMRGVTRPVSFTMNTTNPVRDPWGNLRVGGQSQGTLHRKEWGLVWNQIMDFGGVLVSDEVWFNVSVQALPEAEPNYRVRWSLTSTDDQYQVLFRYNRMRAQAKLRGVSGWMDILNGRPAALDAEFPVSHLDVEGGLLPKTVVALLGSREKVSVRVAEFNSPSPGVFRGEGQVQFGGQSLPLEVHVENLNLPSGNSAFLTARVELRVPQRALAHFAAERRLDGLSQGDGLQTTLWFMSRVAQEQAEMQLAWPSAVTVGPGPDLHRGQASTMPGQDDLQVHPGHVLEGLEGKRVIPVVRGPGQVGAARRRNHGVSSDQDAAAQKTHLTVRVTRKVNHLPAQHVGPRLNGCQGVQLHFGVEAGQCCAQVRLTGGVRQLVRRPGEAGKFQRVRQDGVTQSGRLKGVSAMIGVAVRDQNRLRIEGPEKVPEGPGELKGSSVDQ